MVRIPSPCLGAQTAYCVSHPFLGGSCHDHWMKSPFQTGSAWTLNEQLPQMGWGARYFARRWNGPLQCHSLWFWFLILSWDSTQCCGVSFHNHLLFQFDLSPTISFNLCHLRLHIMILGVRLGLNWSDMFRWRLVVVFGGTLSFEEIILE